MLDVGRKKLPDAKKKTKFVNVPVDEQTLADFAVACALRGVTMAGMLRPVIMEAIREEKAREPEAFAPKRRGGK
jgi:hypothetical protein